MYAMQTETGNEDRDDSFVAPATQAQNQIFRQNWHGLRLARP
jgi:hypothetical protein